jgi:hypothetical protein
MILMLSSCAPIDYIVKRFFAPRETAAPRAPDTAPDSAQAEAPPLPRRKPEAISELTLVGADPERLVGLDFDGTMALLGDPVAEMEQPPARIWFYAGEGCMFRVFFYPSVDNQGFRVLAIEVTDEADVLGLRWLSDPPVAAPESPMVLDKNDSVVRRCFAELLQHQQAPSAG